MNFFRHQQQARQHTALLVILLMIAVSSLIAATSFAVSAFLYFFIDHRDIKKYESLTELLLSPLNLWTALLVIVFVCLGSGYKWKQLRRGGRAVAESLGARLLSPDTTVAEERKVLNIVEEMAIASGNPVPSVYLIQDSSINAFAAGNSRRDAVIGVTLGCIKALNREELQGVIAHEFSHIHNNDMHLNMRLVAILHGILIFGIAGYQLTRGGALSRRRGTGFALIGMALIVIGYCGTFLGSVIKAAVSRQREFLADASAVQFTRNATGISSALKKIGGLTNGSYLSSGKAAEFSHMFFGKGVRTPLDVILSTHPPIIERIKRIEPNWNGSYETSRSKTKKEAPQQSPAHSFEEIRSKLQFEEQAINFIGSPQAFHENAAKALIASVPEKILPFMRNSHSTRAVIYALLTSEKEEVQQAQLQVLQQKLPAKLFAELQQCIAIIQPLPRSFYLTLIELSLPAVKQFSPSQFAGFKDNLIFLIQADKKISLLEWCLYKILIQNYQAKKHPSKFELSELHQDISILFSLVIYAGESHSPGGAFKAAINTLGVKKLSFKLTDEAYDLRVIDQALLNLCQLKPMHKQKLLKAVAAIIGHDAKVCIEEAELFRAIGDTLDCPIPPIIV